MYDEDVDVFKHDWERLAILYQTALFIGWIFKLFRQESSAEVDHSHDLE